MKIDQKTTVTASAFIFGYYLSALLLKHLFYDNDGGSASSIILLSAGLFYVNICMDDKSRGLQEAVFLILFVLFDRNVLRIGNVLLLLGVACVREHLHEDLDRREIVTSVCGLIYLLMGWSTVGRLLVINSLLLFYLSTFVYFLVKLIMMGVKGVWTWMLKLGREINWKKG